MIPPIGNFSRDGWDGYKNHPQYFILKSHIDRAVQDLFLSALRAQDKDFIYIFDDTIQIEKYVEKMVAYWEARENYELCAEIVSLKKKLIRKWKKVNKEDHAKEEQLKEWLRNSF